MWGEHDKLCGEEKAKVHVLEGEYSLVLTVIMLAISMGEKESRWVGLSYRA